MKSTSILLLFIFLPLLTFAQSKANFDLLIGFDRSFRFNEELDQQRNELTRFDARSSAEKEILGWRLGFNYSQLLFEDIKIKLGVRLMHGGFSSGQINDYFTQAQQSGLDGWIVEPPLTDRYEKTYNFYFLELPVGLRYEYEFTYKYQPYIEVGMGPAIIVGSQVREETNVRIKNSKLDDLQTVQFSGYVSAGFNRIISEESMIFIQPIMRVHATTLQKDSEQEDHLYSVGVEFGWRKILN